MAGVETDAERQAFFDPDDFGDSIMLRPVIEGAFEPFDIDVIYDARPSERTIMRGGRDNGSLSGSKPQFRCPASAVPKTLAGKALTTIGGKDYVLYDVEHDGTGMARVELSLA